MKTKKTALGIILISLMVCVLFVCVSASLAGITVLGINDTVTDHGFPLKQKWVYQADSKIQAIISTSLNDKIVFRTAGAISLLDLTTSQVIWSDELPSRPQSDKPVVSKDIVVVSHGTGTNAYDLHTGNLLWQNRENNISRTSTAAANSNIVVTIGEFVDVRDLKTGELIWRIEEPVTRPGAMAAVDDNYLYVVLIDQIRGYDLADGELLWSVDTPIAWSLRSLLFEEGVLYLQNATRDGVAAFNVKTQEFIWQTNGEFKTFSNPITKYQNNLFIPVSREYFKMLNAQTGEIVWEATEIPKMTYLKSLVVDGIVYVKNFTNRNLYALNLQSGELIGYLDLGLIEWSSEIDTGPFLVGSLVIFSDADRIFAYEKK